MIPAEIAFDADKRYYDEWNNSFDDTYAEILNILNNVEAIYENL